MFSNLFKKCILVLLIRSDTNEIVTSELKNIVFISFSSDKVIINKGDFLISLTTTLVNNSRFSLTF